MQRHPDPKTVSERAIYSAQGALEIDGIRYPESELLILARVKKSALLLRWVHESWYLVANRSMDQDIFGGTLCPQIKNALSRQKPIGWTADLLKYLTIASLSRYLKTVDF